MYFFFLDFKIYNILCNIIKNEIMIITNKFDDISDELILD